MRQTRLVLSTLSDAMEWIKDTAQTFDEEQERRDLEKARTSLLWAARHIEGRLTDIQARKPNEAKPKGDLAFQAWCADD